MGQRNICYMYSIKLSRSPYNLMYSTEQKKCIQNGESASTFAVISSVRCYVWCLCSSASRETGVTYKHTHTLHIIFVIQENLVLHTLMLAANKHENLSGISPFSYVYMNEARSTPYTVPHLNARSGFLAYHSSITIIRAKEEKNVRRMQNSNTTFTYTYLYCCSFWSIFRWKLFF